MCRATHLQLRNLYMLCRPARNLVGRRLLCGRRRCRGLRRLYLRRHWHGVCATKVGLAPASKQGQESDQGLWPGETSRDRVTVKASVEDTYYCMLQPPVRQPPCNCPFVRELRLHVLAVSSAHTSVDVAQACGGHESQPASMKSLLAL